MIGLISGTVSFADRDLLDDAEEIVESNEFGRTHLTVCKMIAFIDRHGINKEKYVLPHEINHRAHMKALYDIGVTEIIGINSTGSLKENLEPGSIVVPDDFILLSAYHPLTDSGQVHMIPELNNTIRHKLLEAASHTGINVQAGATYWQTSGPRLETRAEIRLMSQYADIVGMTMATEAIAAQELGLSYASLCSVDNYANGLKGEKKLTLELIKNQAAKSGEKISRIIDSYIQGTPQDIL